MRGFFVPLTKRVKGRPVAGGIRKTLDHSALSFPQWARVDENPAKDPPALHGLSKCLLATCVSLPGPFFPLLLYLRWAAPYFVLRTCMRTRLAV
jgi:hypothetical protein